jgi:cation-transporting ATPase 13A3/4/5
LITVALVITSAVMVLVPTAWITDVMELVYIQFDFRVLIIILAGLNLALSLVCEAYVFPIFSKLIGEWRGQRKARREEKYQREQEVFAPPPQQRVLSARGMGYGSQAMTDRMQVQGSGTGVDIVVPVDPVGPGATAATPLPKKAIKKKASVKIYKIVEDEMMGP